MAELAEAKEIEVGTRCLIAGIGPSGMAAALALLRCKCRVVLYGPERQEHDDLLANCEHRWLCPTTFDFPAAHWTRRVYPLDDRIDRVLPWKQPNIALDALEDLHGTFMAAVRTRLDSGDLIIIEDAAVPAMIASKNVPSFRFRAEIGSPTEGRSDFNDINLVLDCTGPQRPQDTVESNGQVFRSFGFWSNADPLLNPRGADPIVHISPGPMRVLIAGGGDAGLQDFVRLLTGFDDPFEALEGLKVDDDDIASIRSISNEMWLQYRDNKEEHGLLCDAQAKSIALADSLWTSDGELRERIKERLTERTERPAVQLVMKCYHFGVSYFANRVAVHLLARGLVSLGSSFNRDLKPFRVGAKITGVYGLNGHRCGNRRQECAGHAHDVEFGASTCGSEPRYVDLCCSDRDGLPATTTRSTKNIECERILCRFGLNSFRDRLAVAGVVPTIPKELPIRHVPDFLLAT